MCTSCFALDFRFWVDWLNSDYYWPAGCSIHETLLWSTYAIEQTVVPPGGVAFWLLIEWLCEICVTLVQDFFCFDSLNHWCALLAVRVAYFSETLPSHPLGWWIHPIQLSHTRLLTYPVNTTLVPKLSAGPVAIPLIPIMIVTITKSWNRRSSGIETYFSR